MEEAATPLPSEETTPPVTNIYFGAIRVARAVTRFIAPDFSYLSGETLLQPRRGITYKQLWAWQNVLSIPSLCAVKSEIFLATQLLLQLLHTGRVHAVLERCHRSSSP